MLPRMRARAPTRIVVALGLGVLGCRSAVLVATLDAAGDVDGSSESSEGEASEGEDEQPDLGRDPSVDACELASLAGTPGIEVDAALESTWESGVCFQVTVRNLADEPLIWSHDLRLGGAMMSSWNCVAESLGGDDWRFTGAPDSNNVALLVGGETSFGLCMTC